MDAGTWTGFELSMCAFTSAVHPEPRLLLVWFWWWRCWGRRPHAGCLFLLLCWSQGLSCPVGGNKNKLHFIFWPQLHSHTSNSKYDGATEQTVKCTQTWLTLSSVISSYSISPSVPFTCQKRVSYFILKMKQLHMSKQKPSSIAIWTITGIWTSLMLGV